MFFPVTSELPAEMQNSLTGWLFVQTPALVFAGLWIFWAEKRNTRASLRIEALTKELIDNNNKSLETTSQIANALVNIQTELQKNDMRNEKFQDLFLKLSSILEK